MAKHRKPVIGRCAYCGVEARLTLDHVIPRCLFIDKKPPPDIPVVWACKACNGDTKSLDDTYLRDLLIVDMDAVDHPVAKHIFYDTFLRSARNTMHLQSPIARMARNGRTLQVYSPGGIYLGLGVEVIVPIERLRRILSTIVRGLYLAYAGAALAQDVDIDVQRARDGVKLREAVQMLAQNGASYAQAGDGAVFQCVYAVAADNSNVSIWLLDFYQKIVFAVTTAPRDGLDGELGEERDALENGQT